MKILGITGSIRKRSFNTALLREAQKLAPKGVDIEIYVPDKLPLFSQDIENHPPTVVVEFKKKIREANAILFSCPEHNHSVSAVLKNAIEWGNRPREDNSWDSKPGAIMGVGGMAGTGYAQNHLRQIFVELNIKTFNAPRVMISKAMERFDENGNLTDENMRERIKNLVAALVDFAKAS